MAPWTVVCGRNDESQLGLAEVVKHAEAPQMVSSIDGMPLVQLLGATSHSLALDTDGRVHFCGMGMNGLRGLDDDETVPEFERIEALERYDIVQIATSDDMCLALDDTGALFEWGWTYDEEGELYIHEPRRVAGLPLVRLVACGFHFGIAVDVKGKLWGWGWNDEGQLGIGTYENAPAPVTLARLEGEVVSVSCGHSHTLVLAEGGRVYACGRAVDGQLGLGDLDEEAGVATPTLLPAENFCGETVVGVASGRRHSIAWTSEGHVWSWGCSLDFRLGYSADANQMAPRRIEEVENAIQADTGFAHGAALLSNGKVMQWGKIEAAMELGEVRTGKDYFRNKATEAAPLTFITHSTSAFEETGPLGFETKEIKSNIIVTAVEPGSPADKRRLRVGDVITHIEGKLAADFLNSLSWGKTLDSMPRPLAIDSRRFGETKKLSLRDPSTVQFQVVGPHVQVLKDPEPESPAYKQGVRRNHILIEVNGGAFPIPTDLSSFLKEAMGDKKTVSLTLKPMITTPPPPHPAGSLLMRNGKYIGESSKKEVAGPRQLQYEIAVQLEALVINPTKLTCGAFHVMIHAGPSVSPIFSPALPEEDHIMVQKLIGEPSTPGTSAALKQVNPRKQRALLKWRQNRLAFKRAWADMVVESTQIIADSRKAEMDPIGGAKISSHVSFGMNFGFATESPALREKNRRKGKASFIHHSGLGGGFKQSGLAPGME